MSQDGYEKGKQKSGTRLTVGAFYHVGKAVTLGERQRNLSHISLFLKDPFSGWNCFCGASFGV